ncbi:MAG: caspase family protein [Bacteroidales bacterium]|nr:caspase family protein [Bacteroidales bacterium]
MKYVVITGFLIINVLSGMAQEKQVIRGKSSMQFIRAGQERIAKTVKEIPDLVIREEIYSDPNQNNMINANEESEIRFKIENLGEGTAQKVVVKVSLKNNYVPGLSFAREIPVGPIFPSESKDVTIPISGKTDLENAIAEFKIEVREEGGFDAYPLEMKIETHSFEPPDVIVADAKFSTRDGGKLELNQFINLKFAVQNIGRSQAEGIGIRCLLPNEDCVLTGESDHFSFDQLNPGESKEIDFEFVATRRYQLQDIPIRIIIEEKLGKYGQDTTVSVSINQTLLAQNNVIIAPINTPAAAIRKVSLTSDVDRDIPEISGSSEHKYALVIGNEDYQKYQKGITEEINVDYARNDATVFKEYLVKTLGFPEKNVYLLLDATAGEMGQKLDLVTKRIAKAGNENELVFYYAGHGLPSEATRIPFLIPVDVSGANLEHAIKLSDVYKLLAATNASRILVFLDACFSGGGRTSGLLAARSVKVKPSETDITGNTIVFSATSGEQSALPYHAEKHGIFTYFLLKKLQETAGNATYGELADYLTKTVSNESLRINEKEQDPEVRVSYEVVDEWRGWGVNISVEK